MSSVAFLARFAAKRAPERKQMFSVRLSDDVQQGNFPPDTGTGSIVVDKTSEHLVDSAEFIDAIQRRFNIVVGKVPLAHAFSLAETPHQSQHQSQHPSSSSSSSSSASSSSVAVFSIRNLGFTITLQQGAPIAIKQPHSPAERVGTGKKRGKSTAESPPLRHTPAPRPGVILASIPAERVRVSDDALIARMPPSAADREASMVRASAYYMSNRKNFLEFTTALFHKYGATAAAEADDADDFDCAALASSSSSAKQKPFKMLTHQKIVRDYLNIYSPYRGLLLFHGLGSGKTCSSIAIAEGLKTHKRVIVMTPASLQANYIEELKKCGDEMYKRNQFWEFLDLTRDAPAGDSGSGPGSFEARLLSALGFPENSPFIRDKGGAWFVDINKPSNYSDLTQPERKQLDEQITRMIHNKYQFINYNGIRMNDLNALTAGFTENLFDNCVVIIDEAHNFVSRIVNKLKRPDSLSMKLYEYLLNAKNAKVVMLTGTPIINYPNEIGVMFNILRGYIKTWNFELDTSDAASAATNAKKRIDKAFFQKLFSASSGGTGGGDTFSHDYLDYKQAPTPTLILTRNPFGFVSRHVASAAATTTYAGVSRDVESGGGLTDQAFQAQITQVLRSAGFGVRSIRIDAFKALPDAMDEFNELFIESDGINLKNDAMLSRRIMGLTSYFRSAQEKLMPKYDPERGDFQKVDVEMSDYQFEHYKRIRAVERKQETDAKKRRGRPAAKVDMVGELYKDAASTYRIFSRACCNFVFPEDLPRPMPGDAGTGAGAQDKGADKGADKLKKGGPPLAHLPRITEQLLEGRESDPGSDRARMAADEEEEDDAAAAAEENDDDNAGVAGVAGVAASASSYENTLRRALATLKIESSKYLTLEHLQTYSPKFLHAFENINDPTHIGLHLMYSQFRTLEGIGIFKLVMEANGYAQFKVKQQAQGVWNQVIADADIGKPTYALYTGTESSEEKEIMRNVYNGMWDNLPTSLQAELAPRYGSEKNKYGAVIKLLMITASGAEGINLRNVRYVHIMEPYWHPVRTEQIIGRANRICSHVDLPEEERTVKVFLYVMKFTKTQMEMTDRGTVEIRKHDISKLDPDAALTTDESLFEISGIKERVNRQLLMAVKASAMDCTLHKRAGTKESIPCFTYGPGASANDFGYVPDISKEPKDRIAKINEEKKVIKLVPVTLPGGKQYAYDKTSGRLYDYLMYTTMKELVFIGMLVKRADGTYDVVVSGD